MPRIRLKAASRKRKTGESYDKPGDTLYNARRRFARSAERYLEKADNSTGVEAERYKALARGELRNALDTYEKKPKSGLVKRLMNRLDMDKSARTPSPEKRRELVFKSRLSLESAKTPEIRREREARSILNSKIGKRVYGGLVGVWRDSAGSGDGFDRDAMDAAIMDYFNVDSMADVLDILETQVNLYDMPESEERYDVVRLTIEQFTMRGIHA